VYVNRAPVLHKFGIMAFRPKLVKGDVLQVSPLIVKGFNADFDGDAMQFHVPTTDEAVKEAYDRMLPSRSLISPADFKSPVHVPGQQYLGRPVPRHPPGTSSRSGGPGCSGTGRTPSRPTPGARSGRHDPSRSSSNLVPARVGPGTLDPHGRLHPGKGVPDVRSISSTDHLSTPTRPQAALHGAFKKGSSRAATRAAGAAATPAAGPGAGGDPAAAAGHPRPTRAAAAGAAVGAATHGLPSGR
jgi:hypothetical protein